MIGIKLLGKELDTYKDESIVVNSKLKNFKDLGTVFTDLSLDFNLPASNNNNKIFQHYWNFSITDVNVLGLDKIDYRLKHQCSLETDSVLFKNGLLKLISITMRNGMPENYNCSWVGFTSNLKDLFGDQLVSEMDWTELNHPISHAYYVSIGLGDRGGLKLFDDKVIYPLITKSETRWTPNRLATGTPDKEFHPAVKVTEVFKRIQSTYRLTFNMPMLTELWFERMYMWLPNTPKEEDIDPLTSYRGTQLDMMTADPLSPYGRDIVNLDENYIRTSFMSDIGGNPDNFRFEVTIIPIAADASKEYTFRCYQATPTTNGHLGFNLLEPPQNNTATGTSTYNVNIDGSLNGKLYKWYATTTISGEEITYDAVIKAYITRGGTESLVTTITTTAGKIYNIKDDITRSFPDIKVIDFFTAFIKMYNLVIIPKSSIEFDIEPYDNWKAKGKLNDITRWVDITESTIYPIDVAKSLTFKYQDPDNIINDKFKQLNNKAYGDEIINTIGDAEEYTVEVPKFENMLWERLDYAENYYVGNAIKDDMNPAISNAYLLFWSDIRNADFVITADIGVSDQSFDSYKVCDSYYTIDNMQHSLNFSREKNVFTVGDAHTGVNLVNQYYTIELTRLLNPRIRQYKFKAFVYLPIYSNIFLNDDLKIGDNYFSILEMSYNMLTDEAIFTLINTYREVITIPPYVDTEPPVIGVLSIVPNAIVNPPVISSIASDLLTETSVKIEFNGVGGDSLDRIELWRNVSKLVELNPLSPSYEDTGLSSGTTYEYKAKVINTDGDESAFTLAISITTLTPLVEFELSLLGHVDALSACGEIKTIHVWHNGSSTYPLNGDIIYRTNNRDDEFNGSDKYYKVNNNSIRINSIGVVSNLKPC